MSSWECADVRCHHEKEQLRQQLATLTAERDEAQREIERLRGAARAAMDACYEIAQEYRMDWSDFDGRSNKRQVTGALAVLEHALAGAKEGA